VPNINKNKKKYVSVLRIRSVILGTVVKEFQIPWSLLTPHHPQHTKNIHVEGRH